MARIHSVCWDVIPLCIWKAAPQPGLGHAQTGELTQLLQVIVTCAAMMENKCGTRAQLLIFMRACSMLPGVALDRSTAGL